MEQQIAKIIHFQDCNKMKEIWRFVKVEKTYIHCNELNFTGLDMISRSY